MAVLLFTNKSEFAGILWVPQQLQREVFHTPYENQSAFFFLSNINHTDCHHHAHSPNYLSYPVEVFHIPLSLSNLYLGKLCYHSVPVSC